MAKGPIVMPGLPLVVHVLFIVCMCILYVMVENEQDKCYLSIFLGKSIHWITIKLYCITMGFVSI